MWGGGGGKGVVSPSKATARRETRPSPTCISMNPTQLYINEDFLIIDKPSGLVVHPANINDTQNSVVSWLIKKYPEIKNVGEDPARPGIVHRLDKETSGLMLIARTQEAFKYFKKQFQERKINKTYIALVHGIVKKDEGFVDVPLGKIGTKQTTKITGKKQLVPREAYTEFKVLQRFENPPKSIIENPLTLLEVYPKTGRMHQIRVHLNHINYPILCDPLYGGRRKTCPPQLGRLFLHATKISFITQQGKEMTFSSDLAPELKSFLDIIVSS